MSLAHGGTRYQARHSLTAQDAQSRRRQDSHTPERHAKIKLRDMGSYLPQGARFCRICAPEIWGWGRALGHRCCAVKLGWHEAFVGEANDHVDPEGDDDGDGEGEDPSAVVEENEDDHHELEVDVVPVEGLEVETAEIRD